jgi:hypothetical protein
VGEFRNPADIGVAPACHNDVINAVKNNRLFVPGTDLHRERLRLSHMQKGTYCEILESRRWTCISIYISDGECWYSRHRVDYWELWKWNSYCDCPSIVTLCSQRLLIISIFSKRRFDLWMFSRLSRFPACHNDVINAVKNNRLFVPGTDLHRERLRLSLTLESGEISWTTWATEGEFVSPII